MYVLLAIETFSLLCSEKNTLVVVHKQCYYVALDVYLVFCDFLGSRTAWMLGSTPP